ncbi:hypothetical protein JCM1393_19750 [Clostridium carnis]
MEFNYFAIMSTVINFLLLALILITIYKCISKLRNFINKNNEMNKKIDYILNQLKNR